MRGALPAGWTSVGLLEAAELIRGVTYSKADASGVPGSGLVPILRATNIQSRKLLLNELVYVSRDLVGENQMIKRGDIVIATSSGSIDVVGKAAQATEDMDAAFGAFCGLLRAKDGVDSRYLGLFLQTPEYRDRVSGLARGVNINNLKRSHFEQIEIPLAPLAEQKRIADKLDRLLAAVDTCKARLDAIPAILKRFRQSVLAAATSGKLTEEWREKRLRLSPQLPMAWHWVSIEELAVPSGIFDGARDHGAGTDVSQNLRTVDYTSSGVRVISLENLGHLKFVEDKKTYISYEKYAGLKRNTVVQGDVLVGSFVDQWVRVCVMPALATPAITKADCFCVRLRFDLVSPEYLALQLASDRSHHLLQEQVHGLTRPRIATKHLRALRVQLCGIDEQSEIVRRVKELFALAEAVEKSWKLAFDHNEKLVQSVLSKAMRPCISAGECIQDPRQLSAGHGI